MHDDAAVPVPVVHAEAWQAGATLHAAFARHRPRPDHGLTTA
ncbi:hypothetical protein ACIRVF_29915 [Kitasatospora sp. NPDC101157]